jgi:heterodisulfide reductase subunit A-like polyferredoxin
MNGNGKKKTGSVLVVGGGIAGMQASLDCANAGYKVYLLEKEPSIGGNMARLDKTFPTNDCAMCMISPKLVEVGRHLNIEIISYADLKRVEGEAGDFQVVVNKRARYVDEEKCNGCGDCERACPVSFKDPFNGDLATRKAVYRLYPQAIPNVYTINKTLAPPPCRGTCPAGVNAQGYIALIAQGKFLEALEVVRRRMPFAGACGRVCHHPCEAACNRAKIDEAVAVRNLKRFVADYESDLLLKGQPIAPVAFAADETPPRRDEQVAIIGGGPAGMTCADDLVRQGFRVTIFDAGDKLGGMMRTGIPSYRLPRTMLDREIERLVGDRVEVKANQALGRDFSLDDLTTRGFKAVFVATGAPKSKPLPLPNADAEGVLQGIPFLRQVNAGGTPKLGKRIVVIGGGNVAMDVARCAVRVAPNASVDVFCLESRDEMPAHNWEIQEAEQEGVRLHPSWGPQSFAARGGKVTGVAFHACTRVFDEEGRFAPIFDAKQAQTVEADTVLVAIGQGCDLEPFADTLDTDRGRLTADPLTLVTSREGVFAGGDVVLGPASLVEAVAQGHRAAESIGRYLRGERLDTDREPVERPKVLADLPSCADRTCREREAMPEAPAKERRNSFFEIEEGYTEAMAVTEAQRCLNCGGCSECMECVRACKAGAIDHTMRDVERRLNVGAIILAGGFDAFDATQKSEYGFGRFKNVVTSIQFERILSASGPYEGHVQRPSDGKTPKRVAWIQCVGSRDTTCGNGYCSSVCCMYATKEAIVAKEHEADLDATIFYIDMRAYGKGFEGFYNRAKDQYGVRYVRSQISNIKEDPETGDLIVRYISETAGVTEETFDMVVLSVGLVAGKGAQAAVDAASVAKDGFGFAETDPLLPLHSSRPGVFLCGAMSGPKDIPETVMQSSAAAALCGELLGSVRNTEVSIKEYPVERDVEGEEPRIGVFVCHCGINIASVVDVEAVAEYVKTLPGVVHSEHTIYTCSQDTQERMKEIIKEKRLNRVIVASCTPRTHEPLFQETLREAGLNKYLFDMADIREQCSWVHQKEPARATEKSKSLVRGSIGKVKHLEPVHFSRVGVTRAALIIGGGISGMTAAASLARQGFETHLVEQAEELGGNARQRLDGLRGQDWTGYAKQLADELRDHPMVSVHAGAEIDSISGFVGNFKTRLTNGHEIQHGVIVLATGAGEAARDTLGYATELRVITQRELEQRMGNGFDAKRVVMIQCAGSRNAERAYCSRVCCSEAVKNALRIRREHPDTQVYVLYREIRTYGMNELFYREAREQGVRFIRFADDAYPEVTASGNGLTVRVQDAVIGEPLELSADVVVLSAAVAPAKDNNRHLSELLKVPLSDDGFFMEAHVKLRPVDFANEGIFVCGLAHSPKATEENIVQALAVAGRAATVLSKNSLEVGGVVSRVDAEKCASCLTCVRECVYNAPFMSADGKAEIEAAKCQGCGNCASACPARAISLSSFTDDQEIALFHSMLNEEVTG